MLAVSFMITTRMPRTGYRDEPRPAGSHTHPSNQRPRDQQGKRLLNCCGLHRRCPRRRAGPAPRRVAGRSQDGPGPVMGVAGMDDREGVFGQVTGAAAESISLTRWASGSAVEGLASIIAIWRFTGARTLSETAEPRAQKADPPATRHLKRGWPGWPGPAGISDRW